MATNNAINTAIPIPVASGGTGNISPTANSILVGNGSNAITLVAGGADGTIFAATTSSDPSFSTSSNGDFTFTSATASVHRTLTVSNTDNTNSASHALTQFTVGGANVGDPKITHTVTGATSFTHGLDNSDSDKFKISASTALGTTDAFVMTTAGQLTLPLQSAFLAYNSTNRTNVTGDGTVYTIIANTVIVDQNSDYNSTTGTFTAPLTGKYYIYQGARISGLIAANSAIWSIVTSNRTYAGPNRKVGAEATGTQDADAFCVLADLDAADTATSTIVASGSTKVVTVQTVGTNMATCMGGYLAC